MNIAIIPAAGQGARMGAYGRAKQFLEISGVPIIIHTLQKFEKCPDVNEIVVVLPSNDTSGFIELANKYRLRKVGRIVQGGQTRAESVWNGLKSVRAATAKIIAVHDGARPLVTPQEISNTIQKARETGAAILAARATDTIKEVENGKIKCTPDRSRLWRALTPQCFRYDILCKAFENSLSQLANVTDDSFLVESLGFEVSIVEGNSRNIKITHPEDLKLAEVLLNQLECD